MARIFNIRREPPTVTLLTSKSRWRALLKTKHREGPERRGLERSDMPKQGTLQTGPRTGSVPHWCELCPGGHRPSKTGKSLVPLTLCEGNPHEMAETRSRVTISCDGYLPPCPLRGTVGTLEQLIFPTTQQSARLGSASHGIGGSYACGAVCPNVHSDVTGEFCTR